MSLLSGITIDLNGENCGLASFPSRPDEETLEILNTAITFQDVKKVPVTFEVLRKWPVQLPLGEDFIFDRKIYAKY